jgi:hypothetical protein
MYPRKEHMMAHSLDPAILAAQKRLGMKIVVDTLPKTVPKVQPEGKK